MIRGSLRTLLLGSAVSVGLVASTGMAQAVGYNFGSVKFNVDTTISAGASMRTAGRDHELLPSSDGGPVAGTAASIPTGFGISTTGSNALTAGVNPVTGNPNADPGYNIGAAAVPTGSINSNDSRMNFDRGDLTSGIVKMTNDISGSWQNYKFFSRISSYYDAVLSNGSSYARSELVDGEASAARDVKLLDLYVSGDYNIGELPLNVRAGKQVISWGESTFFLNGINSANPIDVSAFRRPGSEVKEGLVPVWALDASIGLPGNLSLEAFYQLKWAPYELDRAGTPFASSDVAAGTSGIGGNERMVSFLITGITGGSQRNCETTYTNNISAAFTADYVGSANALKDCAGYTGVDIYRDYTNVVPTGLMEAVKFGLNDVGGMITRDEDREAKDSGQWGVAGRWYSEKLNNTEFGIYFMNYHSRLPIASERISSAGSGDTQYTSYLSTNDASSGSGRGTLFTGCNLPTTGNPATALGVAPGANFGLPILQTQLSLDGMNVASTNGTPDPDGVYATAKTIAQAYYDGNAGVLAGYGLTSAINPASATSIFRTAAGGINGATAIGTINGANGTAIASINNFSILEASIINCALVALQSTSTAAPTGALLQNGSEIISVQSASSHSPISLYLEYPEDIHMVGASFNTTVGTWGWQGEVSYRSNQPFQLDTDQITIAALNNQCILSVLASPTIAQAANDTYGGGCGQANAAGGTMDLSGVVRSKMWAFNTGTTATYANSNAFIAMTGADLGILVTELGVIYTPDAPDEGDFTKQQWGNTCFGGTDLPFGGALSLAARKGCRPTAVSWGYTLLGQLQYNNAFGTALTLSPTVAFSHDVSGNTPAPISNYRQGRKSVSLQLNASLQGALRGGVSYTNFFGDNKHSDAGDRDFASVNISYAF